jgi:uncharacterized protein YraI
MFSCSLRLLPAAALLLLAGALAPLPAAAQADPTATPSPAVAVTATVTATPAEEATVAPTNTATPAATATATSTPTAAATAAATMTATPAVTATSAATATPAATGTLTSTAGGEAALGTATVRTSSGVRLRVRSGPGSDYPIVARLSNGQKVTLLGRNAAGNWLLVALPGQTGPYGWVSASYLTTSAQIAELPVSSVAPAPAPTATAAPAASASSQAVTPAPGPLPGKIAVPIFDTEQGIYNIWLVNADGTNLRQVVSNASSPALSDDGTLLAYRHWQRDDRGIVVANSDGANPWRVTDKLEDVLPSFSPDKSKIVFSTYRQGDRLSRLYYVWTDEQNRRAWEWGAGGLFGEDPDWMADGQITYHRGGETAQLWLMNGDSTNQRAFFTTSDAITAIAAAPDSRTVAYMADSGGNWDIYRVNTDGSNPQRLTDDPARDGLPAWSPDGASVAFVSDRSGQWALWVMDADGGNQRLLAYLPGPVDGRVQFEPDYLNHGWLEEQIAWSW